MLIAVILSDAMAFSIKLVRIATELISAIASNIVILKSVVLSVVMLSVVILSDVMLNVMAYNKLMEFLFQNLNTD
jgi:hypothetical protein